MHHGCAAVQSPYDAAFKVHVPRVSLGKVGILNSDVDQRQTRPHTQNMMVFGLQTVTQTPMQSKKAGNVNKATNPLVCLFPTR
jgi:hypothetical protein